MGDRERSWIGLALLLGVVFVFRESAFGSEACPPGTFKGILDDGQVRATTSTAGTHLVMVRRGQVLWEGIVDTDDCVTLRALAELRAQTLSGGIDALPVDEVPSLRVGPIQPPPPESVESDDRPKLTEGIFSVGASGWFEVTAERWGGALDLAYQPSWWGALVEGGAFAPHGRDFRPGVRVRWTSAYTLMLLRGCSKLTPKLVSCGAVGGGFEHVWAWSEGQDALRSGSSQAWTGRVDVQAGFGFRLTRLASTALLRLTLRPQAPRFSFEVERTDADASGGAFEEAGLGVVHLVIGLRTSLSLF